MKSIQHPSISIIGRKYMSVYVDAILSILSFGLIYVMCKLSKRLEILLKTRSCALANADCVVILDSYDNEKLFFIKRVPATITSGLKRYIRQDKIMVLDTTYGRFIYDHVASRFVAPAFLLNSSAKNVSDILIKIAAQNKAEADIELYEKSMLYGLNISTAKPPSIGEVFERNIFNIIFIWEILSVILWLSTGYYNYVAVVGLVYIYLFIEGLVSDLQYRSDLLALNQKGTVRLFRSGSFVDVSEVNVFPGDIICISPCNQFKCDAKILKGNVITDESFLTGESVPVCKGPGSSVYAGTRVIKSTCESISLKNIYMEKLVKVKNLLKGEASKKRGKLLGEARLTDVALGIVVRTGKKTKRGMMLTNMTFKKPAVNNLTVQSIQITVGLLVASIILTLVVMMYLSQYMNILSNIVYSLDVLITFFSPSLHTARDLGVYYSRKELLAKQIGTSDPARIGTAGEVDIAVFDKTGTLTETDVDILCIDTLSERIEEFSQLNEIEQLGISTCHYVMELDNQYSGDILDMKMFMFSKSSIINQQDKRYIGLAANSIYKPVCREESHPETENSCLIFKSDSNKPFIHQPRIEVVKIFDFDSYLKRMSVVVKTVGDKAFLFCKGAPDSIRKILHVIPPGYDERINEYGLQGYRVITLAYREVDECPTRQNGEHNLRFCGFVVFANRLKDETCSVIGELRGAEIMTKMCTGDNILTAISVARECGMIDRETPVLFPVVEDEDVLKTDADWYCVAEEDYIFDKVKLSLHSEFDRSESVDFVVACEGREYDMLKGTIYHEFILERGAIFARFNPENKKSLIEDYSGTQHTTMYCGDGANDTGALSAADVGLSLATNEASLAASFNSVNLTAVLELIREGRSALAMSAAQFKYMFYAQALCGIQMASLLPFFYFPADMMSLVTDLMSGYILGSALYFFKSAKTIHSHSLNINLRTDCLFLSVELCLIFLVLFVMNYSFGSSTISSDITIVSKNSTTTFIIMMFVLIYKAYLCADFGPHRQSRSSNLTFILVLLGCIVFCTVLTAVLLAGAPYVVKLFQAAVVTRNDSLKICLAVLSCLLISLFCNTIKSKIA